MSLKPGQSTRVELTIDAAPTDHPRGFRNTGIHAWDAAPGAYTVQVGASSRDLPLTASFTIG